TGIVGGCDSVSTQVTAATPLGVAVTAPLQRYVSTTGANAGDCSNSGSPCLTIAYAISQAYPGDIINVAVGIYAGGPNVIDKPLTLNGDRGDKFSAGPGPMAPIID